MGLAIESATSHVEVLACTEDGEPVALEIEEVGHGHTRRLAPLIERALARARLQPADLRWVAADLGPGSFTGVRVGLASLEALCLASGAEACGASSLASLALAAPARRALIVPLVPAGRRDVYAGYYRSDARGGITLLGAPRVGPVDRVLLDVEELGAAAGGDLQVRFIGPGAAREEEALERAYPGSTGLAWRRVGLSAEDLARAARSGRGPAAGLPVVGGALEPRYVRPPQAEEKVRRAVLARDPVTLRPFRADDLPKVAGIEREVFSDPWPEEFFESELRQPMSYARIAERKGELAGYQVAWLGEGTGHLGNLAVTPALRRHGVARVLVADLLEAAQARKCASITLEVRVSNDAAQALYRGFGFRAAGVRRGYYRDTLEDALLMEWRPGR